MLSYKNSLKISSLATLKISENGYLPYMNYMKCLEISLTPEAYKHALSYRSMLEGSNMLADTSISYLLDIKFK